MVVSTTSPWDQLPREIRDRIYFFAYQNKVPYPVMLKGNLGTGRRASRYLWTEDDWENFCEQGGKAMLLVNKQYLDEAFPVMLRATRFEFDDYASLLRFVSLDDMIKRNISDVTFSHHPNEFNKMLATVRSLPKLNYWTRQGFTLKRWWEVRKQSKVSVWKRLTRAEYEAMGESDRSY